MAYLQILDAVVWCNYLCYTITFTTFSTQLPGNANFLCLSEILANRFPQCLICTASKITLIEKSVDTNYKNVSVGEKLRQPFGYVILSINTVAS